MTTVTEHRSVRALLNRLVDYAGLFPPAKLDMAETVRNYAAYLRSDDSWMLGRLIVPVSRLGEFEEAAASVLEATSISEDAPWAIAALTAPAGTPEFEADLAAIESFNIRHEDDQPAVIDMVEVKADSTASIDAALDIMPPELFAFFEIPITNDPRGLIASLVDGDAGAKVRTGGVTADAYPSPESLAKFIQACATVNVPFKATAGLHHPLRHFSNAVKTDEHGFLNVFIAACLAQTQEMGADDIAAILQITDGHAFQADDDAITVKVGGRNLKLDAEVIEDVRETFAVSFGSCSFDEPREDLRAMKWL